MGDNSGLFIDRGSGMADSKPSFEEQIQALESIVTKLEKGDLALEDSLSHFENGVKLTRDCQQLLDKAQQKVEMLTKDGEQLVPFEAE